MIEDVQEKARKLMAKNKLGQAIKEIGEFLKTVDNASLEKIHLLISGRFVQLQEDERDETITVQDRYHIKNKIRKSLLTLIGMLSEIDEGSIQQQNTSIVPFTFVEEQNNIY
ncbi:MAG: hypothetical protein AAF206_09680, partial [Bacteroidota bacterium]